MSLWMIVAAPAWSATLRVRLGAPPLRALRLGEPAARIHDRGALRRARRHRLQRDPDRAGRDRDLSPTTACGSTSRARSGCRTCSSTTTSTACSTDVPASLRSPTRSVARYKDDPAFLGYYLGDEPGADVFPRWESGSRSCASAIPRIRRGTASGRAGPSPRRRLPGPPATVRGRDAPRGALQQPVRFPDPWRDAHQLTENVAKPRSGRAGERSAVLGHRPARRSTGAYRHVTEGMLRWQIAQWLAGGAQGIGYFTYWTPDGVPGQVWEPAMIEWAPARARPTTTW